MTKEQIAAIAVVLLLGAVFFVRLYRRQQKPPKEPPVPKPLPKIGKMRCPMCGAEAKVRANSGSVRGAVTAVGSNKVWVQKQLG